MPLVEVDHADVRVGKMSDVSVGVAGRKDRSSGVYALVDVDGEGVRAPPGNDLRLDPARHGVVDEDAPRIEADDEHPLDDVAFDVDDVAHHDPRRPGGDGNGVVE